MPSQHIHCRMVWNLIQALVSFLDYDNIEEDIDLQNEPQQD